MHIRVDFVSLFCEISLSPRVQLLVTFGKVLSTARRTKDVDHDREIRERREKTLGAP
jgi:hypothetical protein